MIKVDKSQKLEIHHKSKVLKLEEVEWKKNYMQLRAGCELVTKLRL
jgi:hypothetical protein